MKKWKKLFIKLLELFKCIDLPEDPYSDTDLTSSNSSDSF